MKTLKWFREGEPIPDEAVMTGKETLKETKWLSINSDEAYPRIEPIEWAKYYLYEMPFTGEMTPAQRGNLTYENIKSAQTLSGLLKEKK